MKTPNSAPRMSARKTTKPASCDRKSRGRPSSYRPEYCAAARAFFDIETERTEEILVRDKKGDVVLDKQREPIFERVVFVNKFPTFERFASKIGVSRATVWRWANANHVDGSKKYPAFAFECALARDCQTALLIEGALSGTYDARVAVITLKNICGWRDRPEPVEIEAPLGSTVAALDAIYAAGVIASQCAKTPMFCRNTGMQP